MNIGFRENKEFKILQLTDIHYVDGSPSDIETVKLMGKLIQWEMPDLIVITGDTVYGEGNLLVVADALEPVISSGIPWTFVFGNHDDEEIGNKAELFERMIKLPNCLAYDDKTAGYGIGNHVVDIVNSKNEIAWRLMLLDSGTYLKTDGNVEYDYIHESQINWYKEACKNVTSALAFFHIPLQEYEDAYKNDPVGEKNEDICYSSVNTGFADCMAGDGVTRGVFVGHDHINDYVGRYKGLLLGYGRASGYNTYSTEGYKHGARIILLNENDPRLFKTWQRLEDGSVCCITTA